MKGGIFVQFSVQLPEQYPLFVGLVRKVLSEVASTLPLKVVSIVAVAVSAHPTLDVTQRPLSSSNDVGAPDWE